MEKERLYELFLITTEISRGLTGGNLKHIKQALKGFWHTSICNMDKDDGNWSILLKDGKVRSNISDDSEILRALRNFLKILYLMIGKLVRLLEMKYLIVLYAHLYIFLL